jgi:hypothetical protein
MPRNMPRSQQEPAAAVFQRDGELFIPTAHAVGPWGADRLHGGPVLGLLARGVEGGLADAGLRITRLTFDLFRPVPTAPLQLRVEPLRAGGRLQVLVASLLSEEREVARATGLALRAGDDATAVDHFDADPAIQGPDGIETGSLLRGQLGPMAMPRGFHTTVETRWVVQQSASGVRGPLAIWFRLPVALVEGERATPLQLAAALSDFCNAVVTISARSRKCTSPPYINTDTTLYLGRPPQGEWFGLREERVHEQAGISVTQLGLHDRDGCFGRAQQARLANSER